MTAFAHSLAAVIGIDAYGPGIPPLTTAVNDAARLAALLQAEHGYETILLTQEATGQPITQERLRTLFNQDLAARLGPDDRLLLYFAGHGVALDGDDGPRGYLVPQDARPDDPSSLLAMTDLHKWLTDLPCRHMLAILDCCFAGAFRWAATRHLGALPEVIQKERFERYLQSPAWQVITSASYDQKALDILTGSVAGSLGMRHEDGRQHSPFAQAFFDALQGAGDLVPKGDGDGVITVSELAMYLRQAVEVAAAQRADMEQTPQLWPLNKHRKGEYIFLVPGHPLNLPSAEALTEQNNPYRGLKSYERGHRELFFGREDEIRELAAQVDRQPFVAVLGVSGTGKSSLVKAGLLPRRDAARAGSQWRVLEPMRPSDHPVRALGNLLRTSLPDITVALDADEGLAQAVAAWRSANPQLRLVLTVDQCEELVTLCRDDAERAHFLALLAQAVRQHPEAFRLIITLRTDFEPQLAQDTPLTPYWNAARYVIPPMDQADLRDVIEGPASVRVLYFEPPELVDDLINEVVQMPGALPLLSFTLSEMYLRYVRSGQDDRALTRADYEALGGVIGSLRQRATEEYDALPDDAHRTTMQRVMLRMISVEGGGELARRRVALGELDYPTEEENARVQAVLDRLVDARLLVRGTADKSDGSKGEPYVEPAHDALVLAWDRLLQWKKDTDEYLPLQRRLAQAATEWSTAQPAAKSGLLWDDDARLPQLEDQLWPPRGVRRGPAGQLRRALPILTPKARTPADTKWLSRTELAFVQASVRARTQFWQRVISITAAVVVALTLITIYALAQQREATHQRDEATTQRDRAVQQATIALSRQAAAQARVHLDSDRKLAILLANQATQITTTAEARSSLLAALLHKPPIASSMGAGGGAVSSLALSPDGRRVAAYSKDGAVVLWNLEARQPVSTSLGLISSPSHLAFSPDGRAVYVASQDGSFVAWDVESGRVLTQTTTQHGDHLWGDYWIPSFSSDGQILAAGSDAKAVALWDTATGQPSGAGIPDNPAPISAAAVAPGGRMLALGSQYGYSYLWDVPDSKRVDIPGLYHEDEEEVTALAFDPTGKLLASGAEFGNVHVVGVGEQDGLDAVLTPKHAARVLALAFAPDGGLLASADQQGGLMIWRIDRDTITGTPILGHGSPAESLAFSADRRLLASGHSDGRIILWEVDTRPLGQETFAPGETWLSIALSPDGRMLATERSEGIVLWDMANQEQIGELLPLPAPTITKSLPIAIGTTSPGQLLEPGKALISPYEASALAEWSPSLAFDPDGGLLASADWARITLWDVGTMTATAQLATGGIVTDLAFGPATREADEPHLAATRAGGGVVVWDLATLRLSAETLDTLGFCVDLPGPPRLAFKPDGMILASVLAGSRGYGSAAIWDATGEEIRRERLVMGCRPVSKFLPEQQPDARAVAFSPDGRILAAGSFDRELRIWRIAGNRAGSPTSLPVAADVTAMAFGPDSRTLATATSNAEVVFWDASSLQMIGEPLAVDAGLVSRLAFSPDGRKLVALSQEGSIIVWQMDITTWQSLACRMAGSNLSWTEWNTYFPAEPYRRTCSELPDHPSIIEAQQAGG